MRKQDIIKELKHIEADDAAKFLAFTEEEHTRLLHKIEGRLTHPVPDIPAEEEPERTPRFVRLHHIAVSAACVLFCIGMTGGMVWMSTHAPALPEHHTQTSVPDERVPLVLSHSIGERYAAENLAASGTLYLTVQEAVQEEGLCRVDILLENETAVSLADRAPYLFYADNVQAVTADGTRIPPCRMESAAAGELPYELELHPGESCEVSLWYALDASAQGWRIVTGTGADIPYTIIQLEE